MVEERRAIAAELLFGFHTGRAAGDAQAGRRKLVKKPAHDSHRVTVIFWGKGPI